MRNLAKLMGWPARSLSPDTMTLAAAPISEPLPPRHAPSASDHHTGSSAAAPPRLASMDSTSGIMATTKGMLSTAAETTAESHRVE